MTEHKILPEEIIVELRNLLIPIVRKDARNNTDFLPGGNISWLNADRVLEDYPATFIVPPSEFADCIECGEYYGELRDGSGFWIDCPCGPRRRGVRTWRCNSSRELRGMAPGILMSRTYWYHSGTNFERTRPLDSERLSAAGSG